MNILKILIVNLLMGSSIAYAADIAGITVNGEVGFDYNFLSTKSKAIPYTGDATNETYRLNQAQALLKKETDQISFLGRLVYVPTQYSKDGTTNNKANLGTLDQVEVFYKATPKLQIGFGRFLTTMGYESLLKSENATYNNTIAYQSIVPGYGEGLRAKYVATDWLIVTLSTYNQTTYSVFGEDYTPTKTTELSLTGVLGNFTWFAGYLLGTDAAVAPTTGTVDKSSSSVWACYKILDNLMVAVTYDSYTRKNETSHTQWADSASTIITYGIGMHNFAVRYEMVRGANEIGYGAAETVNSTTISDKLALNDNFKIYLEYRMDQADKEVFFDTDGLVTKKEAGLFTLGALASF
ncbi:outer membrane beta-barrel protein [Bdellovibrio sp.]|uniref:outer membrane beta-barrel protein n=1 Tax=Bdellovibrio sp. TaxID=28201 RepID=UPI0039E593D5